MACCGLRLQPWLSTGSAITSIVVTLLFLAGGVHSTLSLSALEEPHRKIVLKRPKFAVYALINNVACGRCGTSSSDLEEARKCLPKSVNLENPVCMREEQYLLEYGENVRGVLDCYREGLLMKPEQLHCLLEANHLQVSPGYTVIPPKAPESATIRPEVASRAPFVPPRQSTPVPMHTLIDNTYSTEGMKDGGFPFRVTDRNRPPLHDFEYDIENHKRPAAQVSRGNRFRRKAKKPHWLEEYFHKEIKKNPQNNQPKYTDIGWHRERRHGGEPDNGDDIRPDERTHDPYPRLRVRIHIKKTIRNKLTARGRSELKKTPRKMVGVPKPVLNVNPKRTFFPPKGMEVFERADQTFSPKGQRKIRSPPRWR